MRRVSLASLAQDGQRGCGIGYNGVEMKETIKPRVAVITRTKDRGVLLERAIKSVHGQTLQDYIHVIINDSGDKEVVDSLVRKYEKIIKGRVKVIHNSVSHGMEAASNRAIKSVDSEFVAIHDDDDSWHPRFLEVLVDHMTKTDAMGAIARTERIYESVAGDTVKLLDRDEYMPHLSHLALYDLFAENFAVPISFMYRRSAYKKIGYYSEDLRVTGDWDFALRFMRQYDVDKVDPGYALAFYHIRPHDSGVMSNSIYDQKNAHIQYHTMLANRFLREDLDKGALGFGYLFNVGNAERARGWEIDEMRRTITELSAKLDAQSQLIATSRWNLQRVKMAAKEKLKGLAKKIKAKVK